MRATWRPLAAWPYPDGPRLTGARIRSGWDAALELLDQEITRVKGDDVVIGVVCDESAVGLSGTLRSGARTAFRHRGVEVSFDHPDRGRVVLHTDAYDDVTANLRAVGLGLEALRAVDRHGITSSGEQYAGFAQLSAGGPDPTRGQRLVEEAGSLAKALKAHHPDHGGSAAAFADVQAYRKSIGAGAR